MFLQVGGGNGFRGLHGHPDEDGAAVVVGACVVVGCWSGFVAAGGGVVFFGLCCVLGVGLELDGALLLGVELSVVLGAVLEGDVIQLEAGVLLSGSSPAAPWNAMPTSTPSNADPSTAEPPAAHSARTAVLL
ncbi:hypothetical protein [Lentzea sp. HUAS12]|uniref:hypothetical protein n=1 Tax=Lentzea sp. HUAS12 TaxID=2951806 RepID=UPI00209F85B2|nr:hypothetical protein [Lentzea sp. HUAS12]USX51793.1 hypothetical protein ND450_41750 [Lentzea sp. HUAS12]